MENSRPKAALLAYNTFLSFAGQIITLICAMASIPYVLKGLGTDRFGILSIAWVVLGYFGLFDMGLSRATTKYVSECLGMGKNENIAKIVWTSSFMQLILGAAGCLLCIFLVPYCVNHVFKIPAQLLNEATFSFYLIAASLPVVLLSTGFRGVLEASQRFDLVNIVKIPSSALLFLVPAACVFLGLKLPVIMLILVIMRIATVVWYLFYCLNVFPELNDRIYFEPAILRELMNFGAWVTLSSVLSPILTFIERFFIVTFISLSALSYYSVSYEAVSRLTIFASSIATTLFPAFSYFYASKTLNMHELFLRPLKYLLIVMVPIVLFLYVFASQILTIWLGQSFASNSIVVFRLLCLTFFLNSLAIVPYVAVQGAGRSDIKAILDIFETILFVFLTWFLTLKAGINGVAGAKLIITVIDIAALLLASHIIIRFSRSQLRIFRLIPAFTASIIFMLAMLAFDYFFHSTIISAIAYSLCIILYISFVAMYVLDTKDKTVLQEVLLKWKKLLPAR